MRSAMKLAIRHFAKSNPVLWGGYGAYRAAHHRVISLIPRRQNDEILPAFRTGAPPTLSHPSSQICTAAQCDETIYKEWCKTIRTPQRYGRKQWEHVFILETLRQN